MTFAEPPNGLAPNWASHSFLRDHVDSILRFYAPHAFDPEGGFFHAYLDDGSVYDQRIRHLVSATRFVFNWSMAWRHTGRMPYLDWARHALEHLKAFRRADGLYGWTLDAGRLDDASAMAYGHAFVLLAHSHAARVGLASPGDIARIFDLMEDAYWEPSKAAYADEITPGGTLIPYRGQNANMHQCEACLAAYEATGEARYLDRAEVLIERFAFELADLAGGLVWEHYTQDWSVDWEFNRDNPGNIFKPWGFQTGHQTEWAKLLLIAHGHRPQQRWIDRAVDLHQAAWCHGWDELNGGLIYGFTPERRPCDTDKYFWVQAESFASAWRLWRATGKPEFRRQYDALWEWSWRHLIDPVHGGWYRIVAADGRKLETTKSPPGKVDYHTMGACWDVMAAGGLDP